MDALLAWKKATVWEARSGLYALQVMPGHVFHFLSALFEDYPLYEVCRHIISSMCSPVGENRFYLTDSKTVLAHRCGRHETSVLRSRICHEKARIGVLSCRIVREREVVGSYYGSLAYGDRVQELQWTQRCDEEYIEVIGEWFWRWALELSKISTDSNGQKHSMLLVPAPFYAV